MDYTQRMRKKQPKLVKSVLKTGDMQDQLTSLKLERTENLTPEQMELRIQADRVGYTLTRTMKLIRVMAHLPSLIDNEGELLFKYLKPEEASYILKVLESFGLVKNIPEPKDPNKVEELGNVASKIQLNTKSQGYTDTPKMGNWIPFVTVPSFELNPHLAQLADIICYNKCINYHVFTHKKLKRYDKMIEFVDCLGELKAVAARKLYMTGLEEADRDKQLRNAYKSNVLLTSIVNEMKEQLETKRKELGEELNKTLDVSAQYHEKINTIKEEFQITLGKMIHDSEKNMMRQFIVSEEKQALLSEEAKKLTAEYETLLDYDLKEEKTTRAKRMKTLVQLQSWLTKYDQDMNEKQIEMEQTQAEYDAEREAMDALEDKFVEQAKEYEVLMAERDAEEQRILWEMAYQLLRNRAARIIQRAWRAYRIRKKNRKKGKKGGKGGKAGKGGKKKK